MNIWFAQTLGLNVSPHLFLANHKTNEIPLGFYIHTAKYGFNYFLAWFKKNFDSLRPLCQDSKTVSFRMILILFC